jgi:hypothetical protein
MAMYTLTNWTRRTSSLHETIDAAREAKGDELHQGDSYTIWSMVSGSGTGEPIEEGVYDPSSD